MPKLFTLAFVFRGDLLMRRFRFRLPIALGLLAVGLIIPAVGCQGSIDPAELAARRDAFLLTEEPAEKMSVAEAKESVTDPQDIVVLGQIGAGSSAPWSDGEAQFIVSEVALLGFSDEDLDDDSEASAAHAHDHDAEGHDPSTCPFCSQAEADVARAIVKFQDEQGRVIGIDARKLFELEEKQLVVVTGRGEVDTLGNLVIAASGIYVRR
ncbi:MAG: hypothetical protein DWQ46_14240 [Planctomycetota bacterium]|nr:MAG: hypothetical protein DWQ46_14240 [Planctomycetota bacterium]